MKKIIRLLALMPRKLQLKGVISVLLSIVDGLFQTFSLGLVGIVIGILSDPGLIENNKYLIQLNSVQKDIPLINNIEFLRFFGISVFLIISISFILRITTVKLINSFVESVRHTFSTLLLEEYLHKDYSFHLESHSSKLLKFMTSEMDGLANNFIRPLLKSISALCIVITLGYVFISLDPFSSLILAILFVSVYTVSAFSTRNKFLKLGKDNIYFNESRFQVATEALTSIKVVKTNGLEDFFLKDFNYASKRFSYSLSKALTLKIIPPALIETSVYLSIVGALIFLENQPNTIVNITTLSIIGLGFIKIKPSIDTIFNVITSYNTSRIVIERLLNKLETKSFKKRILISSEPISFEKDIVLKEIFFQYPNTTRQVLINVNLTISKGEIIGFIGKTGSGKSSLIDIIVGLLSPIKGNVLVDNIELNLFNMKYWLDNVGYVTQEPILVDKTIIDNIIFNCEKDEKRIEEVLKICDLDSLRDEIGTNCKIGERGKKLSGGQRQRIGIARAIYKKPELLILDESTSALDSSTEEFILENLRKTGLTILIISHSTKPLKLCDKIYEIKSGNVILKQI